MFNRIQKLVLTTCVVYCHPKEIYSQILKFDIEDSETKELFLVLKEQIELWNSPRLDWKKHENYTRLEMEREMFLMNEHFPKILYDQLIEVRKDLILDERYMNYHDLLPEIKLRNKKQPYNFGY